MSLRYLLDTNIFSDQLRPTPNALVTAKFKEHKREIATAAIVIHEMIWGCIRTPSYQKRQLIEEYINNVILPAIPILPYNLEAAIWHGTERARLVGIGKTPDFADSQIAAIAHINRLIIVTNNVSDYENFQNLQIENWYEVKF